MYGPGPYRDVHVMTRPCPTRLDSDLGDVEQRHREQGCRLALGRIALFGRDAEHDQRLREIIVGRLHHRAVIRKRALGPSGRTRSEEHTSELQSLMRLSYAVSCLKKKSIKTIITYFVSIT